MTKPRSKDTIARLIRALRAKTVENGCTEGEALQAATKLAALLAEHNMTVDEAEMRESEFRRHTETHDDLVGERLWKIADAVSYLTNSRYWISPPGVHPIAINFFGFDHEVDVSVYLLEICAQAMRREYHKHRSPLISAERMRRRIAPLLDGMADRLQERIRAMKPPRPAGTGLVVLHKALIDAEMTRQKISLRPTRTRGSRDPERGYLDGRRLGDRVSLNPGLTGRGDEHGRLLR